MIRTLQSWLINVVALPYLLRLIHIASFATAFRAAVVLGLINAVFRPVLLLLTLLMLCLIIFVINRLMSLLASKLFRRFVVESFMVGVIGSALYSVISWLLSRLLPFSHRDLPSRDGSDRKQPGIQYEY